MLKFMKPGFGTIQPENPRAHELWVEELMQQDLLIEGWRCDLATGIFTLGERARILHALDQNLCGLLGIIRGYRSNDRDTVLNILDEATAAASSFCFCTTIEDAGEAVSPIVCVGTSSPRSQSTVGGMRGIFAFCPA